MGQPSAEGTIVPWVSGATVPWDSGVQTSAGTDRAAAATAALEIFSCTLLLTEGAQNSLETVQQLLSKQNEPKAVAALADVLLGLTGRFEKTHSAIKEHLKEIKRSGQATYCPVRTACRARVTIVGDSSLSIHASKKQQQQLGWSPWDVADALMDANKRAEQSAAAQWTCPHEIVAKTWACPGEGPTAFRGQLPDIEEWLSAPAQSLVSSVSASEEGNFLPNTLRIIVVSWTGNDPKRTTKVQRRVVMALQRGPARRVQALREDDKGLVHSDDPRRAWELESVAGHARVRRRRESDVGNSPRERDSTTHARHTVGHYGEVRRLAHSRHTRTFRCVWPVCLGRGIELHRRNGHSKAAGRSI